MPEFKSYRDYRQFAASIKGEWRFSRTTEQGDFLQAVLATSVNRQETIVTGSHFWRAQLGHDWDPEDLGGGVVEEHPGLFGPERMRPLSHRAPEGRANPKGIPYLYVATHQETAVAEARPWIGSYVSIAELTLKRDIRVVNCVTGDDRVMIYFREPEPRERERAVWHDIDRAFSRPVTSCDDVADYAPTQVIAEFFRENGLDGVAYGSSLGPGHNVALFDIEVATLVNCGLAQIRSVKLDFSVAANPYFVASEPEGSAGGTQRNAEGDGQQAGNTKAPKPQA